MYTNVIFVGINVDSFKVHEHIYIYIETCSSSRLHHVFQPRVNEAEVLNYV